MPDFRVLQREREPGEFNIVSDQNSADAAVQPECFNVAYVSLHVLFSVFSDSVPGAAY
jgi:hypothetical protein